MTARRRSLPAYVPALAVAAFSLVVRVVVLVWARGQFPAAADGVYYHTFAGRLARGLGYTWAWPDGVVTYAAHYPVGYPALLAPAYALFGESVDVAIGVNVVLGVVMSVAMHALLARATTPRRALLGGLLVAAHPALVPYAVALMTEGATVALVTLAFALGVSAAAPRGPLGRRALAAPAYVLAGLVLGVAVLVRPQCLVLAPVCGALFVGRRAGLTRRLGSAVAITALVLGTVAPWTLRNCARMKSCALVSVNGGWNLLIGEQTQSGAWEAVKVPEPCLTVWDEAKKDKCFGDVARANIARAPGSWLARAPQKLAVTFDYFGGAPWYLHQASPTRFSYDAKVALGTVETVFSRLALVGALVALGRLRGPRRRARGLLAVVLVVVSLSRHAWPAYLGLVVLGLLLGPRALARGPALVPLSVAMVASTALLHAVFFGAGRYGLVVAPFVCALSVLPRRPATR